MNAGQEANDKKVATTIIDLALENIDEVSSKAIQDELTDERYGIIIESIDENDYQIKIETGQSYSDVEVKTRFEEDNQGVYAQIQEIGGESFEDLIIRSNRTGIEDSNFQFNQDYQ